MGDPMGVGAGVRRIASADGAGLGGQGAIPNGSLVSRVAVTNTYKEIAHFIQIATI